MVSAVRWQRAQQYERSYWESLAQRIATGGAAQLDWYRWRADQLILRLRSLGLGHLTDGTARIVEVGSGPIGVIGFFPGAERVAVDPLEPYYRGNPTLAALRDSAVEYRAGSVEALPCESRHYDLAIMENCIDHVRDAAAGMRELRRVLTATGALYFTVNCRTRWGYVMHRVLSRLRVDAGHPHTFTPRRAHGLLREAGFSPLQVAVGSYAEARREDLAAPELRARLKAWLGVSEFLLSAVAQPSRAA